MRLVIRASYFDNLALNNHHPQSPLRRGGEEAAMSRIKMLWVLALTVFLFVLGTALPAQADGAPPAPTPSDVCGVSQDQFYTPNGQSSLDDVSWSDSLGNRYSAGYWHSTNGAASVTLTATVNGSSQYTYPAMTFGTEPDSSCVEALDTVTTRVVSCNSSNSGTVVEFVYTNTDDPTNRAHTRPALWVERWDQGQSAYMVWTEGQVTDGASLSVTGGDAGTGDSTPNHFFLAPGTYSLTLTTNETGSRVLPNRLFVPACGTYKVPAGDPMGGSTTPTPSRVSQPRATISRCRAHVVRVTLDARLATSTTRYRLSVNPLRGRTIVRYYNVSAATMRLIKLRYQRSGTVVKVTFNGLVVKRRLRC